MRFERSGMNFSGVQRSCESSHRTWESSLSQLKKNDEEICKNGWKMKEKQLKMTMPSFPMSIIIGKDGIARAHYWYFYILFYIFRYKMKTYRVKLRYLNTL